MSTPSGYSSVATDPEQAVHFDSMQLNNSVIPVCVESGKVETRTMRKWRQFPGRNQFYCDGRLMLGRGLGLFYLTCFLIVVPTLLFLAFEYVLLLAVYRVLSVCNDSQPFHSWANSLPGANRPIEPWPIRSLAHALPGPFAPWPTRSLESSLPGPFAPWPSRYPKIL